LIVDYSAIRPPAAVLKAAGVTAAGRYIGWDSVPGFASIGKNITRAEADALTGAGIAVFLAFEYAADAVTKGAAQGRADGRLAITQLAALGAPAGMTVYFAVDFDIPDYAPRLPDTPPNAAAKLGPAADYFRAITTLGGRTCRVGIYGGYYACKRTLDAGLAVMAWQTVAWSGGQRDPRAVLYQLAGSAPLAGADVNIHESTAPDFGQWPRPKGAQPDGPARPVTEEDTMIMLDLPASGPAAVLPVPAGAKTLTLYADPGYKGLTPPELRVIFHGQGARTVTPGWDSPAALAAPAGSRVSIARLDTGNVPVTAAWS
jgi:hypothetical protein